MRMKSVEIIPPGQVKENLHKLGLRGLLRGNLQKNFPKRLNQIPHAVQTYIAFPSRRSDFQTVRITGDRDS